jgi:hypothetical protein
MLQNLFENVHSHHCSSPGQRRIAANIAKLPELLRRAEHGPVLMSAFGGKADMVMNGPNVCFWLFSEVESSDLL